MIWPFGKAQAAAAEPMRNVLSILSPAEAQALGGLPSEAVLGTVRNGDKGVALDRFVPNPLFVEFMHKVIGTAGPDDADLQAAAAEQGEGWVYIIDLRTPEGPLGRVPPEDIIGAFQVREGHIVRESYWANVDHRIATSNGLVSLPPSLRAAWVNQLPRVSPRQ